MRRPLTRQQEAVFEYIRDQIVQRGYGPTVREIGERMNIKSPNGVMCHLRALERKGVITRAANKSRAIELTEKDNQGRHGPVEIRGFLLNGVYLAMSKEVPEFVSLPGIYTTPDVFAIKVIDDSLTCMHTIEGDYLLVRPGSIALVNEIVLVQCSDGESIVCRWREADGETKLANCTPHASSHSSNGAQILGVVLTSVRPLCQA